MNDARYGLARARDELMADTSKEGLANTARSKRPVAPIRTSRMARS